MWVRSTLITCVYVTFCIGRSLGDCPLPPHPAHGRHRPNGNDCGGADRPTACDGTPGTLAPESWLLVVHCDPGYQLPDPEAVDVPSVCIGGTWSIPKLPSCILPDIVTNEREMCKVPEPPPHAQFRPLEVECGSDKFAPGSNAPRDCILFVSCATGYRRRQGSGYLLIHCYNNTWNPNIPQELCTKADDSVVPAVARPTKPPTNDSPIAPLPVSTTGCVLPAESNAKFCSFSTGCRQCDFSNTRCHLPPGSRVDKVKVVCAPGHTVHQNIDFAVCDDNGWHSSFPKCVKLCPPLVSDALLMTCRVGTDIVNCSAPALPGTTVSFQCLPGFSEFLDLKRQGEYRKIITCRHTGKWSSNLPICRPACGVSKYKDSVITPTIIDGAEAHVGLFPWHAGLYYRDNTADGEEIWSQQCGGSLITDRVVLTAAHCLKPVTDKRNLRVALGKFHRSWNIPEITEQKRNVTDFKYTHDYNPNTHAFDIGLIFLSEKIKFGEYIMPVCLDFDETTTELQNSKSYVVGWGRVGANGPASETLLYNTLTVMSEADCKQVLPYYTLVHEKFCAYKNNSDSTTQQGDSGGGLTAVYRDGLHYIVGITSTKHNLVVSVFTNVKYRHHITWIQNQKRLFENLYSS